MTLNEFRPFLLAKSLGRTQLPSDSDLKERIFTGLKLIAKETVPLTLIIQSSLGAKILRRLDENMYIRMPMVPEDNNSELDIDDALLDALAYYVMAGLERGNANTLMGMYHGEIDMNNDRLTETILSTTTNNSDKYCQFP